VIFPPCSQSWLYPQREIGFVASPQATWPGAPVLTGRVKEIYVNRDGERSVLYINTTSPKRGCEDFSAGVDSVHHTTVTLRRFTQGTTRPIAVASSHTVAGPGTAE